jgi:tRNA-dihydrouridine synthase
MNKITELNDVYLKRLSVEKSECISKIQSLKSEDKEDEAKFEKIKLNIYEIFESLYTSFEKRIMNKKGNNNEELYQQFCKEYLETFQKIPMSWKTKLEYAIQHDMAEEKVLEELKLEVAKMLQLKFIKAIESSVI